MKLDNRAAGPPRITPRQVTLTAHEAESLAAQAIALLRDRGESVLNAIDDGIYILDGEGRTLFVNTAGARMLGYASAREMIGQPQHQLIHHSYADGSPFPVEECPIFHSVTDGIQQQVGGDTFWRKDGTALPVDYTSIPLKEGRRVLGAVITFRDVSEHIQAEQAASRLAGERKAHAEAETARAALARNERRYRSLVESVAAIVWTRTPEGEFVEEQSMWCAFTGQSPDEARGRGWLHAVHPDDRQRIAATWDAAVASGMRYEAMLRLRRADGAYRRTVARAVPVRESDGSVHEWIGTHTDVTELLEQAP
ncbi:MAG: PAS domain S-box protein [Gemmatimonadaceae bacterium]|nr:PAS domain S-box protein [Gemmatimonadaceae bacterium]NUQ91433.1 PAS domain S-box protein [Gemmatimonadaceae bacterium]NUR20271.1 PAS domain S-box protein [Gemmatimonadaceae bacterium]NUS97910.1 PAS domain S-box protein [Gemmatimonadaceae bacterium]